MLNKVIIMGRLTADPEIRQTQNGTDMVSFCVAVERNFSDTNGQKQTDFIHCAAWKATAQFISKYFSKGQMIALEGSIQTRNYEDKSGNKRTAVEVVVDAAYFADSKPAGGVAPTAFTAAPSPAEPAVSYASGDVGDFSEMAADSDDLPF